MDTKRWLSVMLVSLAVIIGWLVLKSYLHTTYPEWFEPHVAQTQPAAPGEDVAAVTRPGQIRVTGGESATVAIGSFQFDPDQKLSPYPLGLRLDSRGAAIASATLNRFRQEVGRDEPYVYQTPYTLENLDQSLARSLATRLAMVDGQAVNLARVDWEVEHATDTSATFAVRLDLPGAQGPLILRKYYEVLAGNAPGQGYEVRVQHSAENQAGRPVSLQLTFNGPTVPPIENPRDQPEVVVGHPDEGEVRLTHEAMGTYTPEKGPVAIPPGKGYLWAGMTSAYFTAIIRPESPQPPSFAEVRAQGLAPPSPMGQQFIAMGFTLQPTTIAPGATASMPLEVYLGPRMRDLFKTPYYVQYPRSYDKILILTGWFCGICTWTWLINALVGLLAAFHFLLRDWGLAIIALVVLVRLVLHPITKKSQISMSKMGKMGPEVERLKKKYGDNKEELNKAMMALYKEQGFTPILGCLPMFLQMPIWIALWTALQTTFALRHSPFLEFFGVRLTWINDLAQPDRLIPFFPGVQIPLLGLVDGFNLLPLLMGFVFYLQQKYMPKPPTTTPEQAQQQKLMQYMTLAFPLLLYTAPAGLNLYILTSTAIGIWESKRVRAHLKEQEEREKAARVIVDAPATRGSRKHLQARAEQQQQSEPGGCLGGWFVRLQRKAEEFKRVAEKKPKKR
jgi:YidC/Oxa1 family membrane protein insertase